MDDDGCDDRHSDMMGRLPPTDDRIPRSEFAAAASAGRPLRTPNPVRESGFLRRVPLRVWWLWGGGSVAALAAAVLATNGIQSAFAILALVAVISLCHRPGEPPALLYAGVYQWMQASMDLLLSDFRGEHLDDRLMGTEMVEAAYLTLVAVVCFSVGARLGAGRAPLVAREVVDQGMRAFAPARLAAAWAATFVVAVAVSAAAYKVPAVSQFMLAFIQIRWALVLLLAAWTFWANRGFGVLAFVVLVEALYGMLGFFSAFKSVFVVAAVGTLFVAWANPRKVKAIIALLVPVVLLLGIYWTSMKEDYRSFLNQGTGQQVVLVTPQQQLAELADLAAAQSGEDLANAVERMFARIGYVFYFAAAINYVPGVAPHQDGGLWMKSIRHVLVPRVVDPDKPALDDSERTTEFTGLRVAGLERGTSIGLGYVAESYVDFGPILMFVPILLWGLLVGSGYRLLARRKTPLLGIACGAVLVVFGASLVETSNTKMLGGFITVLVAFSVLLWALGPRIVQALSRPGIGR